jgi:hypothetical protein
MVINFLSLLGIQAYQPITQFCGQFIYSFTLSWNAVLSGFMPRFLITVSLSPPKDAKQQLRAFWHSRESLNSFSFLEFVILLSIYLFAGIGLHMGSATF